jgi:predicted AAA+ superfamily ATPase
VADTLDPVNGLETDGVRTYTLWGELGAQLGPPAWAALHDSDEQRTAPGKETLQFAIGEEPTVIIIDEIAQHLRQLASSGTTDVPSWVTARKRLRDASRRLSLSVGHGAEPGSRGVSAISP